MASGVVALFLAATLIVGAVASDAGGPLTAAHSAKKRCKKKGHKRAVTAKRKKCRKKPPSTIPTPVPPPRPPTTMLAHLSISPTSYDFGRVASHGRKISDTFTLTNSGPGTSGALRKSISAGLSWFSIDTDTCGTAPLAPGSSCTMTVAFSPGCLAEIPYSANLQIAAFPGGLAQVRLSGTCVP